MIEIVRLQLLRIRSGKFGTFGQMLWRDWVYGPVLLAHTLEPEWKDNKPFISCIPDGIYTLVWDWSPSFGWCYRVCGVEDRTDSLVHAGNWAGDKSQGLRSNTGGCILTGDEIREIDGQLGVTNSRKTLRSFNAWMRKRVGELEVTTALLPKPTPV